MHIFKAGSFPPSIAAKMQFLDIHFDPHAIRNHWVAPIHSQFHPKCRTYMFYCKTLPLYIYNYINIYIYFRPQDNFELPNFLANARTLLAKSSSPLPSQNVQMHAQYRAPKSKEFLLSFFREKKLHPLHQLQHVDVRLGILGSQALLFLSLTRQCPALCPWRFEARWDKICEGWFICLQYIKRYTHRHHAICMNYLYLCVYVSICIQKCVHMYRYTCTWVMLDLQYVYCIGGCMDDLSSEKTFGKGNFLCLRTRPINSGCAPHQSSSAQLILLPYISAASQGIKGDKHWLKRNTMLFQLPIVSHTACQIIRSMKAAIQLELFEVWISSLTPANT